MTVVRLLQLHRREVAVDLEQPVVIEPVDPAQGGGFDAGAGVGLRPGVRASVSSPCACHWLLTLSECWDAVGYVQ